MRRPAHVLQREMRGTVEVHAGDPVWTGETSDVVLGGLDPEPAGIVRGHRTGAVDREDDILAHLRDPAVVDRGDVLHGDVRGRHGPGVELKGSIAGGPEGGSGWGAERDRDGELAARDRCADRRVPDVVERLKGLAGGRVFRIVLSRG